MLLQKIKQTYQEFGASLQPWQHDRLREQYAHAQQNEGETRPYEDWKAISGLPAYFRGYPFQQWDNAKELYTAEQTQNLDGMMNYLRGQPSAPVKSVLDAMMGQR